MAVSCHPVLRHGVSCLNRTTDAGILRLRSEQAPTGMTAIALSPRAPSRGQLHGSNHLHISFSHISSGLATVRFFSCLFCLKAVLQKKHAENNNLQVIC